MKTAKLFKIGDSQAVRLPKEFRFAGDEVLIGSHAQVADLILVTHNAREFSQIEGLRLEDWSLDYLYSDPGEIKAN